MKRPGNRRLDPHAAAMAAKRGLDRGRPAAPVARGIRQIPTDGPLFLLDAVTGLALAALLLVWAAPLAGLAAGYSASTLGALLISLNVGLFRFRESISASFVTHSLVIETITVLALLGWTALLTTAPQPVPTATTPATS